MTRINRRVMTGGLVWHPVLRRHIIIGIKFDGVTWFRMLGRIR